MDFYCERSSLELFAEPFNTLSNIAFLIAASSAWVLARRLNAMCVGIGLLIALLTAIAIGSALYHALATQWARLMDLAPILLFQLCYLWLYTRWPMGLRTLSGLALSCAFFAALQFAQQFPDHLNGSWMYAPAVALLVALGVYHFHSRKRGRFLLLTAAGILTVSLFFRTIDRALCPAVPTGTHFVWHLLNGLVLYLALRALLLNKTPIGGAL